MSKKTNTQSKSATQTPDIFHVGATVWVNNERTDHLPRPGVIATIAKGWYNILLDDKKPDEKPIVSARVSSLVIRHIALVDPAPAPVVDPAPAAPAPAPADTAAPHPEDAVDAAHAALEDAAEEAEAAAEKLRASAQGMKEALRNARAHYVKAKRPNGAATAHNGDLIARALADLEPKEVAMLAELILGEPKGSILAKYARLNPGQIRMNSGNRIRGYIRNLNARKAEEQDAAKLLEFCDDSDRVGNYLENTAVALEAWYKAEEGSTEYPEVVIEADEESEE